MSKTGVKLEGIIYALEGSIGNNEFLDEFLKFIESKGWEFGGGSYQIDEDGNQIDEIDA